MKPIGIFDSGIGGLTIYKAIRELMPNQELIYVADSIHLPYGDKSMNEILQYSKGISERLMEKGCQTIVIACNTASAAALHPLRKIYHNSTFVGMEPAVKPAAEQTQSGVVGVIATVATFQGELFKSVVERHGAGVKVIERPCPGLVQQIEAGHCNSIETETMLRHWLEPMLASGMDRLVLACTHYPFVLSLLQKICGTSVTIIDPAPAIARQVVRVVREQSTVSTDSYFTTGNKTQFVQAANNAGYKMETATELHWQNGHLTI